MSDETGAYGDPTFRKREMKRIRFGRKQKRELKEQYLQSVAAHDAKNKLILDTRAALERWYTGTTDDPSEVIMYAENLIQQNKELADALRKIAAHDEHEMSAATRIRIARDALRKIDSN